MTIPRSSPTPILLSLPQTRTHGKSNRGGFALRFPWHSVSCVSSCRRPGGAASASAPPASCGSHADIDARVNKEDSRSDP